MREARTHLLYQSEVHRVGTQLMRERLQSAASPLAARWSALLDTTGADRWRESFVFQTPKKPRRNAPQPSARVPPDPDPDPDPTPVEVTAEAAPAAAAVPSHSPVAVPHSVDVPNIAAPLPPTARSENAIVSLNTAQSLIP
jgi:hypothetical protein